MLMALRAGYKVVLEDFSVATVQNAATSIQQRLVADSPGDHEGKASRRDVPSNLSTSNRVEDAIRDADLIIETSTDEMETKLELFTVFDKFAKPNAILATTSKLHPISEIAEITACPDRCVALHFDRTSAPLRTDVIPGATTSLETMATCRAVLQALAQAQSPPRPEST